MLRWLVSDGIARKEKKKKKAVISLGKSVTAFSSDFFLKS